MWQSSIKKLIKRTLFRKVDTQISTISQTCCKMWLMSTFASSWDARPSTGTTSILFTTQLFISWITIWILIWTSRRWLIKGIKWRHFGTLTWLWRIPSIAFCKLTWSVIGASIARDLADTMSTITWRYLHSLSHSSQCFIYTAINS